MYELV